MSDTEANDHPPTSVDEQLAAAGELLRANQVAAAREILAGTLASHGEDIKALGLFGLACFRLGAFDDALPVYRKLVELRPSDASNRLNLGLVHLKLGDAKGAVKELHKSRELDPSQPRTVSYLGLAYARLGDYGLAYDAFLRAGQDQLADEMEQYLTPAEQAAIRGRIGGEPEVEEVAPSPPPAAAPEAEAAPVADSAPESEAAPEAAAAAAAASEDGARRGPAAAAFAASFEAGRGELEVGLASDAYEVVKREATPSDVPSDTESQAETGGDDTDSFAAALSKAAKSDDDDDDDDQPTAAAQTKSRAKTKPKDREAAAKDKNQPASKKDKAKTKGGDSPPNGGPSDGRPVALEGDRGRITEALELALPSAAATNLGARAGAGHTPPLPLTDLATARLIRPDDGDAPFEIGAGGVLVVRVKDRVLSRTEGVVVSCGDLKFEPATRRARGAATDEIFGEGDKHLSSVTGQGYLVASPLGQVFTAVALDDDIVYLREPLVYAFEETLRWENGRVPGSNAQMRVVQFRGNGCVAVRTHRPMLSIKLVGDRAIHVGADVLAGWIGRVVPRVVTSGEGAAPDAPLVECSGEGVVLLEDQGGA